MQLIAVDIGNSSTKIAVDHMGDDDRWSSTTIVRDDNGLDELKKNVLGDSFSCCWVVCSVNKVRQNRLARWVQSNRPDDQFHIISADDVPLKTAVESREQLGRDRLLAAWMATNLDDESGPLIVIDAGTAVTIDYVDAAEVFQGGVIYPGADSNFRQLAQHTDALPDLSHQTRSSKAYMDCFGKSTQEAILKGVFQSQAWAIHGIARQLQACSKIKTPVYVTGGGIPDLIKLLPDDWFDVPDLVLRGAKLVGSRIFGRQASN